MKLKKDFERIYRDYKTGKSVETSSILDTEEKERKLAHVFAKQYDRTEKYLNKKADKLSNKSEFIADNEEILKNMIEIAGYEKQGESEILETTEKKFAVSMIGLCCAGVAGLETGLCLGFADVNTTAIYVASAVAFGGLVSTAIFYDHFDGNCKLYDKILQRSKYRAEVKNTKIDAEVDAIKTFINSNKSGNNQTDESSNDANTESYDDNLEIEF